MMMQIHGTKKVLFPKDRVYCLFLAKLGLKIDTFLMLMGANLVPDSYSWVMDSLLEHNQRKERW